MVKTNGLTHIAPAVKDPARSLAFYQQVPGVVAGLREPGFIQAQTPGIGYEIEIWYELPTPVDPPGP